MLRVEAEHFGSELGACVAAGLLSARADALEARLRRKDGWVHEWAKRRAAQLLATAEKAARR